MGNGFNKFLDFIGFGTEEEPEVRTSSSRDASMRSSGASSARKASAAPRPKAAPAAAAGPRVVNMPNAARAPQGEAVRMVILHPQSSDDAEMIIDNLLEGKAVVIVLTNAEKNEALRIVDYVAGAIYALDGEMKKVDRTIFICAPHGVDITGDVASSFASSLRKSDRR